MTEDLEVARQTWARVFLLHFIRCRLPLDVTLRQGSLWMLQLLSVEEFLL